MKTINFIFILIAFLCVSLTVNAAPKDGNNNDGFLNGVPFQTLSAEIEANQVAISDLQNITEELRLWFNELTVSIEGLNVRIEDNEEDISLLETEISAIGSQIADLETTTQSQILELESAIEAVMGTVDANQEITEAELAAINYIVITMNSEIQLLNGNLSTLQNMHAQLQEQVDNSEGESVWSLNGLNAYYNEGRVGIGTMNPPEKLSVLGGSVAVRVTQDTNWGGGIYFQEQYLNMGLFYDGWPNALYLGWKGSNPMYLTVEEGGNVGIGIMDPSYKLHVNGTAAGTSWTNLSSREYKENIKKVDASVHNDMLDRLMELDLNTYNYRQEYSDDTSSKLGFIAEELPEEVLSKDGKGVDIYELLTFTIGAMKAQQKEMKALRAELELLKLNQ